MKIYYISTRDVRKNRADCVHVMRTCHEFVNNGFEVNLVTPFRYRSEYKFKKKDIWKLYNLPENFKITELKTILVDNMPKSLGFLIRLQKFFFFMFFFVKECIKGNLRRDKALVYSICYASLFPALLLRKCRLLKTMIFFEKSDIKQKWIHRFTMNNIDGMIAINAFLKDKAVELYNFDKTKMIKRDFPSMTDDIEKIGKETRESARGYFGYGLSEKIVVYAGKISPKMTEIHLILEAAQKLPDIKFIFVGMREISRKYFEDYLAKYELSNVTFLPFQPVDKFIKSIKMADILVSYYDAKEYYSATQRVPAKASIYLASEKPVIFADLPGLREWFGDDMVYFTTPNTPSELSKKIRYIFDNPEEAEAKARKCYEFAREHTYSKAYQEVSVFIKELVKDK